MTNLAPDAAVKADTGKLPVDLFPPEALLEITKVLAFGAQKYAAHNWRKGMSWSRMYSALQRHLLAWQQCQDVDPESGLHHLAHAGCCLVFLLTYATTGVGTDDRWRP